METFKVSVLVPIYRTRPEFLREAIRSVLAQTFRDFELLLLDDCPEDDREFVICEFDDPRIVYRKNERNLGIAMTRNRLIDLSKGEYLAVFDHDDVCRPDRLEKEVAYLDTHPSCGVVGGRIKPSNGTMVVYPENDDAIRLGMISGCCVWHPAAMIRKEVLLRTGVRYEAAYSPCEDYKLWFSLMSQTEFHNLPDVLIDYRWHENNTSVVHKDRLVLADMRCKAWARVNLPELYAEYELCKETITRVKVLGLPLFKIITTRRYTDVLLFGTVKVLSLYRKFSS